jgi:hypothetical protein
MAITLALVYHRVHCWPPGSCSSSHLTPTQLTSCWSDCAPGQGAWLTQGTLTLLHTVECTLQKLTSDNRKLQQTIMHFLTIFRWPDNNCFWLIAIYRKANFHVTASLWRDRKKGLSCPLSENENFVLKMKAMKRLTLVPVQNYTVSKC